MVHHNNLILPLRDYISVSTEKMKRPCTETGKIFKKGPYCKGKRFKNHTKWKSLKDDNCHADDIEPTPEYIKYIIIGNSQIIS